MARCLIIGCGCRGRALGHVLVACGHAVRGTTRASAQLAVIEQAGIEAHLGDPDRVATIAPAFEHVTVACVLLGSAEGSAQQLRALHGSRLEMLLGRLLDTTVRGVVYEAAGTVDRDLLHRGAQIVRKICEDSRIPYALMRDGAADHQVWLAAASAATNRVLDAG